MGKRKSNRELAIADMVTEMLEVAAREQIVTHTVNDNGEDTSRVDLAALQTVVKNLKVLCEIRKEFAQREDGSDSSGVVLLPAVEE